MKVLVTGGTGFAGRHLVDLLLKSNHQVIATSNNQEVLTPGVKVIQIDLTDAAAIRKIDFHDIDAIYHLAGLAAVGVSFDEPRKYLDVNAGIQINLFEECLKQNVRPRFLVVSSGNVYAPEAKLPLTETSPTRPASPYAVSKLTQEIIGEYYLGRDFQVVFSRSFNHIGPGQVGGFIVADFAKQIAHAEKLSGGSISCGNLDARRDYTDVRDIAEAYCSLIDRGKSGQVYNVCSGKSVSGHEILSGLLAHTQADIEVINDPSLMRPVDILEIYGSYNKISRDTGWQPKIKLEQTLRETLDYWRRKI